MAGTDISRTDISREPVAARDSVWLQDAPHNLMVINSVFTLDRMDRETLRGIFVERVLEAKDGRFARFRRKVVYENGRPYWEADRDFDVDRHIVLAPPVVEDPQALSTRERLQEFVGQEASRPLPEDRPRWRMLFIPEYRDGQCAVVIRVHHVMADGMSLVPVLFSMMDETDRRPAQPEVAKRSSAWQAVAATLAGPFLLTQKFLWRKDASVVHGSALSGVKRVAWTDPVDLALVKRVKDAFGAKVNDVLMACVSSGFERYVRSRSGEELKQLRCSMPVNVRSLGELPRMENKFAAVMLDLPVGVSDIRERVTATKQRLDRLKRSPEPLFTYGIVRVMLGTLPSGVSRGLINYLANKCTCVISNVPGPQEALYLRGRRLRGMMFWVPQRADIGIGVSMLSFAGELMIGVICDTAMVEDPKALVACFSEELRLLEESVEI